MIHVVAYSGYRGEESPRKILLGNKEIEVVRILDMWREVGIHDTVTKRVFSLQGDDHHIYRIHYDEKANEWYHRETRGVADE